jgi:polyisoprenoid-binding protein YceI
MKSISCFFRRAVVIATVCLVPVMANAQQALVADKSIIQFVSKQMGVPVEGRFGKFNAQINFDPKQVAGSKIGFTVDLGSAVIGDAETQRELRKPDWFDVAKFPQAIYQSSAVKALGGGKFEVAGNLTIKGVAMPVVSMVQLTTVGAQTVVEGVFPLKRLDFKIGDGDWKDVSIVANEVSVKFKLTLSGVGPL